MQNFKSHLWYYTIAIAIFVAGLVLVMSVSYSSKLQSLFVVMVAVLYFMWSLIHHYVHHELHTKVVVEYALMASLGVILSMLLFNA